MAEVNGVNTAAQPMAGDYRNMNCYFPSFDPSSSISSGTTGKRHRSW